MAYLSLGNTTTEVPGYGRTGFILRGLGTSGNVSIQTGRKFREWNGENSVHRYETDLPMLISGYPQIPPTNTLCNDKALPKLLKDIEIGLVQVPQSPSSVPTLPEISDEFFIRFPDMIQDRQVVLETRESLFRKKMSFRQHVLRLRPS